MEIFDFLHLTMRRLIALVVVALVAGAATAVVLSSDSSDSYEADAVVFLGQVLPADRSTFAIAPFAGDLEVLLSLDPTREELAAASGVDGIQATDLSTRQISGGTAVGIQAIASDPALAETLATEAARVGLSTLLEQERNRAQRTLEAVNRQLLQVRADFEQFRGDNSILDPVFEFRAAAEERVAVQVELSDPGLSSDDREPLEARLEQLNEDIARLAPLQAPYNELDRALLAAEEATSAAKREVAAADALLAGAASGDFVVTTPATATANQSTLRAGVAASMVVVALLAIGLFVWIDRRRQKEQHQGLPQPEPNARRVDPLPPRVGHDDGHAEVPEGSDGAEVPEDAEGPEDSEVPEDSETDAVSETDDVSEADDDATEQSSAGEPSTPSGADPDTTSALSCVCGRVCRTERGLSAHQRACEVHQQMHEHGDSDDDDRDSEIAVDDSDREPTEAAEPTSAAPVKVLISGTGASEDQQLQSHHSLKQALEAAGLNEGSSFTIANAPDPFTQIRQAEQAIDDGVSVILLVGSDSETSATITMMAEEAGVEIVEQRVPAARSTDPLSGEGDSSETDDHVADEERTVAKTVAAIPPLGRPSPRWAPVGQ